MGKDNLPSCSNDCLGHFREIYQNSSTTVSGFQPDNDIMNESSRTVRERKKMRKEETMNFVKTCRCPDEPCDWIFGRRKNFKFDLPIVFY